jgi:hypothetical protein
MKKILNQIDISHFKIARVLSNTMIYLIYTRVYKAELNSWKVEISNTVRIYQQFCDRNLELKKREDELQLTIKGLETTKVQLQKTMLNECQPVFHEGITDNDNLYDENGVSYCSPVSSLPDDSDHQYPPFQCKSTKAIIGF